MPLTHVLTLGSLMLFAILVADPAAAQERPRFAAEFVAGWVGFADDGSLVSEGLVGAAARVYVLPRIGVGPEVVYVDGGNHSHVMVTGNMTWDILPTNGRPRQVTPFLVVGGGVFHTRESAFADTFTSTEGAFTAGGGLRAPISDRVTVGVDLRVGWELHLRVNGSIGLRLGP